MGQNYVKAPKTDIFQMRLSPELKYKVEEIYAKNGLSLTDAVNVFFQQSLNAGGFPFPVTAENSEIIYRKSLARLAKELTSNRDDSVSYTKDEMRARYKSE